MASDWETVWDFYAAPLRLAKSMAVDNDAMGIYQTFKLGEPRDRRHDDQARDGLLGFYFIVPAIDAAVEKMKSLGGELLMARIRCPAARGSSPAGTRRAPISI